jgi:hypothetical protein
MFNIRKPDRISIPQIDCSNLPPNFDPLLTFQPRSAPVFCGLPPRPAQQNSPPLSSRALCSQTDSSRKKPKPANLPPLQSRPFVKHTNLNPQSFPMKDPLKSNFKYPKHKKNASPSISRSQNGPVLTTPEVTEQENLCNQRKVIEIKISRPNDSLSDFEHKAPTPTFHTELEDHLSQLQAFSRKANPKRPLKLISSSLRSSKDSLLSDLAKHKKVLSCEPSDDSAFASLHMLDPRASLFTSTSLPPLSPDALRPVLPFLTKPLKSPPVPDHRHHAKIKVLTLGLPKDVFI